MMGAILAGGRSRRMEGQDKTRMLRDGRRVLERLAGILRGACGGCVLVAREEQRAELEALDLGEVYGDLFPDRGPLGGLYTVLEETEDDVFLVACDLPFLEQDLVEKILREYDSQVPKVFALVPRSPDPDQAPDPWRVEPLCAIWSRHCKRPAYIALEAQELSLTQFAHGIHARFLDLSAQEAQQLRNINTMNELNDEGLHFSP
ncbi:MAG: molybdenum cofactor guanylyltransferase [Planctomycetes bacterium]|nr:molybdenum cofactor guanylyltransferase [Planctomycetota bacterium]